jgi:large subunit ribosomal protein L6
MSRIGNLPVKLPQGVTVGVGKDGIEVKGPKGTLKTPQPDGISCKVENGEAILTRRNDERKQRALHGLARALLANAVNGVTTGWSRALEIQGIGYRAAVKGDKLELALGFSHPVVYPIPKEISIAVEKNTRMVITGIDRQQVGQVAAEIRRLRPPEPYKGKGIRYAGEIVRKKVGKTGA